jgi:hypothetical protein
MTSRNVVTIFELAPLIVTLYNAKALMMSSQNHGFLPQVMDDPWRCNCIFDKYNERCLIEMFGRSEKKDDLSQWTLYQCWDSNFSLSWSLRFKDREKRYQFQEWFSIKFCRSLTLYISDSKTGWRGTLVGCSKEESGVPPNLKLLPFYWCFIT